MMKWFTCTDPPPYDITRPGWVSRSRRNPRSRCAWLTRTPFGVCANLLRDRCSCRSYNFKVLSMEPWALELTSEFSHAHLTIFSTVWDTCWFYQDHASRRNAKLQKIYQYFVGQNRKVERKNSNISKNHLSTVYLKSSEKIICSISEIQWQTKIIKMWWNRTSFQVGWSRPTPDGGTIPAR